ncbi:S8 family serine peptidase [uncultured Polaribacter sp.]|uniref:S8 family serine peptidase n=1 Tax=uncultured Polaribacter sp. TaxID=174711 RepID=UPI00261D92FC|nr:S8 family serine peptidase [uncultured Polaribacter sp.]
MKKNILILVFISFISCEIDNNIRKLIITPLIDSSLTIKSIKKTKNWHLKDIELDTIPGISLLRAYDSLLIYKKSKETIIAIIDNEVDINHLNLKETIWVNKNEIANNNIDDDENGYIDDVNGWNFLGNINGENNKFVNFEYTRILKKLSPKFESKNIVDIEPKDSLSYQLYINAKEKYDKRLKSDLYEKKYHTKLYEYYFKAKKELSKFFKNKPFTIKALDSLKNLKSNTIDDIHFLILIDCLDKEIDDEYVIKEKYLAEERLDKLLGLNYNDREIQGDNPEDITDTKYGNNILNNNIKLLNHGTKMAGIINNIALNNEIKIMPLAISAYGDEHDKDIALAIRYAVNNGAKVINMSFGKEFSIHKEWVFDAIQYAEKNNVLIISSAGNFSYNLDTNNNYFPNDNVNNQVEVSDNFMLIGATSYKLSSEFKTENSNYGKIDVDVFAPGYEIYTTAPNNEYTKSGGTSSASAVTSGVAGLIRSYYPNLTAPQVKHILMDSGLEYTLEVSTPTKEDKNKTTPFNQLSKSGKVLNAYNALIMADSISKN